MSGCGGGGGKAGRTRPGGPRKGGGFGRRRQKSPVGLDKALFALCLRRPVQPQASEQVAVGPCADQLQDRRFARHLREQQPVRLDMAFPQRIVMPGGGGGCYTHLTMQMILFVSIALLHDTVEYKSNVV